MKTITTIGIEMSKATLPTLNLKNSKTFGH